MFWQSWTVKPIQDCFTGLICVNIWKNNLRQNCGRSQNYRMLQKLWQVISYVMCLTAFIHYFLSWVFLSCCKMFCHQKVNWLHWISFVFLEMGWWFVRSPEPIVAPPGDEVVFECSLNVPAEQVRWRHGGHFLHHNHGNDTSSSGSGNHSNKSSRLVVRVHDEHQAGDYQVWIITALM